MNPYKFASTLSHAINFSSNSSLLNFINCIWRSIPNDFLYPPTPMHQKPPECLLSKYNVTGSKQTDSQENSSFIPVSWGSNDKDNDGGRTPILFSLGQSDLAFSKAGVEFSKSGGASVHILRFGWIWIWIIVCDLINLAVLLRPWKQAVIIENCMRNTAGTEDGPLFTILHH